MFGGLGADWVRRRPRSGSALTLVLVTAGCSPFIPAFLEDRWKENFAEALIPGYEEFDGLGVDTDLPMYMFSYRLPATYDPARAVPELKLRITKANPCFKAMLQLDTELQMRCSGPGSEESFGEWRVLVDPQRRRVTVMLADIDSPVERQHYPGLVEDFRQAHRRE